jgi:DnaJ-class molecular chaperone
MKSYREQNHYELLEISPDASPLEIRRAYKKIFDLYQDDSMASYSFFSEGERREILARVEDAYLALISAESRAAYDRGLVEQGFLEKKNQYQDKMKDPVPIYDFKKVHAGAPGPLKQQEEMKRRAAESPVIRSIMAQERITGADLRRIRMEMDVPIEEVAAKTSVRIEMLRAIEEEHYDLFLPRVYMIGFLRSYVRYLQLDENIAVGGYFKGVEERKQV